MNLPLFLTTALFCLTIPMSAYAASPASSIRENADFAVRMEALRKNAKEQYLCVKKHCEDNRTGNRIDTFYHYDEEGLLRMESSQITSRDPEIHYAFQEETTYYYNQNDLLIRTEYLGTGTDADEPVQTFVTCDYTYSPTVSGTYEVTDSDGFIHLYREDGTLLKSDLNGICTVYDYLENGDLKSETTQALSSSGQTLSYSAQYRYEWDKASQRRIVHARHTNPELNTRTEYEYDDFGNCVREMRYNHHHILESITEYQYMNKNDLNISINQIRVNLNVPDEDGITWETGYISYSDTMECCCVNVTFYKNGKFAASAVVIPNTGELLRNIAVYQDRTRP